MNPETVRKIDIRLGKPLCLILTTLRYLSRFLKIEKKHLKPVKKILFIKLTEQGALVLAHHAICRGAEMVGRRNSYFLLSDYNYEFIKLLDKLPSENLIIIRMRNIFLFLFDVIVSLIKIHRLEIDATIDLEFFSRGSAILSFLTGANRRVGLHRFNSGKPYRGDLMTHRVQDNPYLHVSQSYYLLVEALKEPAGEYPMKKQVPIKIEHNLPKYIPKKKEIIEIQRLLSYDYDLNTDQPIILLNPNTNDLLPLRRWPKDRYIELSRQILTHSSKPTVVITGVESERGDIANMVHAIGTSRVVNLAGKTSLSQLLTLYSISDILITSDCGPGHFASLTGINVVSLFGPVTPSAYGPIGKNITIIWQGLACSPCLTALDHYNSPCRENICMHLIHIEDVYKIVHKILKKQQVKPSRFH